MRLFEAQKKLDRYRSEPLMNLEYEHEKKRRETQQAEIEEANTLRMIRMYMRHHKMKMKERADKLLNKYRDKDGR